MRIYEGRMTPTPNEYRIKIVVQVIDNRRISQFCESNSIVEGKATQVTQGEIFI